MVEVRAAYRDYEACLVERLWRYRRDRFGGQDDLFDGHLSPAPPVFRHSEALRNVLTRPGDGERARLLATLPRGAWHYWLGSMKSSQALVWSLFANLAAAGRLSLLANLPDDRGQPLFPDVGRARLSLESEVDCLGEPRPTSLDALLDLGSYHVAVEGKLTEREVGACSRPRLSRENPGYCDGTYTRQLGRTSRCSLAEIGVAYWRHVPTLFHWSAWVDRRPCPLEHTYQLVRNVLAATVRADGRAESTRGHAVLLYDARNPEFGPGGAAWRSVEDVRAGLRDASLLRLGTWQQVAAAVAGDAEVRWLAEELGTKYGVLTGSRDSAQAREASHDDR